MGIKWQNQPDLRPKYLWIPVNWKDKEIIKAAKKLNPEIEIYQMKTDPEAFKLKAEIIES